jgi:uncharacterized membrane protein
MKHIKLLIVFGLVIVFVAGLSGLSIAAVNVRCAE